MPAFPRQNALIDLSSLILLVPLTVLVQRRPVGEEPRRTEPGFELLRKTDSLRDTQMGQREPERSKSTVKIPQGSPSAPATTSSCLLWSGPRKGEETPGGGLTGTVSAARETVGAEHLLLVLFVQDAALAQIRRELGRIQGARQSVPDALDPLPQRVLFGLRPRTRPSLLVSLARVRPALHGRVLRACGRQARWARSRGHRTWASPAGPGAVGLRLPGIPSCSACTLPGPREVTPASSRASRRRPFTSPRCCPARVLPALTTGAAAALSSRLCARPTAPEARRGGAFGVIGSAPSPAASRATQHCPRPAALRSSSRPLCGPAAPPHPPPPLPVSRRLSGPVLAGSARPSHTCPAPDGAEPPRARPHPARHRQGHCRRCCSPCPPP
jgi:hypothetical protein